MTARCSGLIPSNKQKHIMFPIKYILSAEVINVLSHDSLDWFNMMQHSAEQQDIESLHVY